MTRTGWSTFTGTDGKTYSNYFFDTVWVWNDPIGAQRTHRLMFLLAKLNTIQYAYDSEGIYEVVVSHD